jgi:hypothetical protein
MPATMEVREGGHVIYFRFTSPFTTGELLDVMRKDGDYRATVAFKVHALVQAELTEMPPMAFRGRQSPSLNHPTSGYFVIVGANPMIRFFAETVVKMVRKKDVKFFDTEEQGWAFLREIIAEEQHAKIT